MFIGEYTHSIDGKGRLAIPSKFRSGLKMGAVVTKGIDQCLFLYPMAEWDKLAQKIAELPVSGEKSRVFARFMLSGAMEVEFDRQGRILLPGYLRQYAKLKEQAVIIGLFNRLEIWDEKEWEAYKEKHADKTQAVAEELGI